MRKKNSFLNLLLPFFLKPREKPHRQDCDPSNYDRVHNKARCPSLNCRERLGPSNKYDCRACRATTCLKHRHAVDHGCAERSAANAAAARSGSRWGTRLGGVGRSSDPGSANASLARTVSGRLRALFSGCASPGGGNGGEGGGRRSRNQQQQQRIPPAAAAAAAAARRLAGNSSKKNTSTGK